MKVVRSIAAGALALAVVALPGCRGGADLQTEVIAAKTMKCGMCEENVKKAVYGVEGVKSVEVDLKELRVTVKFAAAQTNLQTIERAITDAGYDANGKARDPLAYDKLDSCCKDE